MASLRNHRNLCHTPQHAAYLLLYELKQGASIHILAREERGAAEDKGIGSGAARWRKEKETRFGSSWCLNCGVRPLCCC